MITWNLDKDINCKFKRLSLILMEQHQLTWSKIRAGQKRKSGGLRIAYRCSKLLPRDDILLIPFIYSLLHDAVTQSLLCQIMCPVLWILECKCCGKKWSWSSVRCSPLSPFQDATAPCIPGRPHYRDFKTILDTPYTVVFSGRVIGQTHRPLYNNTQHSQETDICAPDRIRNRISSIRAAADTRLRTRGHWIDSFRC